MRWGQGRECEVGAGEECECGAGEECEVGVGEECEWTASTFINDNYTCTCGWLLDFRSSLKIFPGLSSCAVCTEYTDGNV